MREDPPRDRGGRPQRRASRRRCVVGRPGAPRGPGAHRRGARDGTRRARAARPPVAGCDHDELRDRRALLLLDNCEHARRGCGSRVRAAPPRLPGRDAARDEPCSSSASTGRPITRCVRSRFRRQMSRSSAAVSSKPCGCSSSAAARLDRASTPMPRACRRFARSASSSTGCRWRSSFAAARQVLSPEQVADGSASASRYSQGGDERPSTSADVASGRSTWSYALLEERTDDTAARLGLRRRIRPRGRRGSVRQRRTEAKRCSARSSPD